MNIQKYRNVLAKTLVASFLSLGCGTYTPSLPSSGQGSNEPSGSFNDEEDADDTCDNQFGLIPAGTDCATAQTFFATADAFTNPATPSTNYGSRDKIYSGVVGLQNEPETNLRGFFKFNLSRIPSGALVHKATLRINTINYNEPENNYTASMTLSLPQSSWTESGLTFLTMPSNYTYVLNRSIEFGKGRTYSFDVTGTIQKIVDGDIPNNGFSFTSRSFTTPNSRGLGDIYSREYREFSGPSLFVDWEN